MVKNENGTKSANSHPPPKCAPINKKQVRRMKANCRERNRMHGLNQAMDILRLHVPLFSDQCKQRLSKIETLRLARNYILALNKMAEYGQMSALDYACQLSLGLSQTTANQIATTLGVAPLELANRLKAIKRQMHQQQSSPHSEGSSSSTFTMEDEEMDDREEEVEEDKNWHNGSTDTEGFEGGGGGKMKVKEEEKMNTSPTKTSPNWLISQKNSI